MCRHALYADVGGNLLGIMRQLLFILTLVTAGNANGQEKCLAIINWKYLGSVELYDKPDGKITGTVKNDSTNEDYLHLEILDQTDKYFYVNISSFKISNLQGWIKKADYIGAYKKHEEFPMDLVIYKTKTVSEENKIVIKNWTPELLTIKQCTGAWTLISLKQSGTKYEGWIETFELCANAYTYCN